MKFLIAICFFLTTMYLAKGFCSFGRSLSHGSSLIKSKTFNHGLSVRGGFYSSSTAVSGSSTFQEAGFTESNITDIKFSASDASSYNGDIVIVPFYKPDEKDEEKLKIALKDNIPSSISDSMKSTIADMLDDGTFKADVSSKMINRVSKDGVKYIALVGMGTDPKTKKDKDTKSIEDMEVKSSHRLGKMITSMAKETKAKNIGICLPTIGNAGITQMVLGIRDASYNDIRYKKEPEGGHKPTILLENVSILNAPDAVAKDISLTTGLSDHIASGVQFAKDLVNAPPNSATPVIIADACKKLASEHGLEIKVLGAKECQEMNMGAYLGVQSGSMYPPQFVHMTYKPKGAGDVPKIAFVGKGLTFDSGGYNIKAGGGSMIELMKFDMGGCGAVLGAAKAIAQLKPANVEVHFITALCENMISSEAMKPGDILTASNGKTIEVLNTDAEGRLTLADALVYAEKTGADTIIDLATLTGACVVALGDKYSALFTRDDSLREDIEAAAKRSDELIWTLPLADEYKDKIKSSIADIKNIGGKGGGSITAALFLEEFVEKAKWAHIDMAGPVWENGPTGYGVKTLVDFALTRK